jgi:predicted nucleic acid-binding protein
MFEVANSLLVLVRRRRISPEEYMRARNDLVDLRPLVDDEGPSLALGEILELAGRHSLSVYDAAYLELASRRDLPLASRDSALNKAARRAGVRILLD